MVVTGRAALREVVGTDLFVNGRRFLPGCGLQLCLLRRVRFCMFQII